MATPARRSGRFSPLLSEIEIALESEFAEVVEAQVQIGVTGYAEGLNQAVRRLRQADGFPALAAALSDAAAPFCEQCAVFERVGDSVMLRSGRGVGEAITVPLDSAGAFRAAMDSGDPISALATPTEVSQPVVSLFAHAHGDRVSIFPVSSIGLLYASGKLQPLPLELLAQVAGMARVSSPQPEAPANLVTISPLADLAPAMEDAVAPVGDRRLAGAGPDAREQRLHLRAQQFARTQVAQMRLHRTQAVARGRTNADLYGALRGEIEAVREAFQAKFLSAAPTMADYVHLELLRTLAHDNPALLGPGYPGPLV
jgi:hypothetical protein